MRRILFDMKTMLGSIMVEGLKHYAHMLIVVAFLVVNFLGFLVITRHHEDL